MENNKKTVIEREDIVIGRNAVTELLKSGKSIESIYLQKEGTGSIGRISSLAAEKNVPVKWVSPAKLDNMCAFKSHQGAAAVLSGSAYSEMEDIFAKAGDDPLFVVIADGIEDPHNLGAIIRSAEALGAHGVIIPKRRSAGLSFTAAKSSAGAVFHIPVVRVTNLSQTIGELKKQGVWFFACDMEGEPYYSSDFTVPLGIVVGSEGDGIKRLVREKSDYVISIPMYGSINSLNASVAAGIVFTEVAKQRRAVNG